MLCTTPSPTTLPLHPDLHFQPRHKYESTRHQTIRPAITSSRPPKFPPQPRMRKRWASPPSPQPPRRSNSEEPPTKKKRSMNASTQTNPLATSPPATSTQTPTHKIGELKIQDKPDSPESTDESASSTDSAPAKPLEPAATQPPDTRGKSVSQTHTKRQAESEADEQGAEHEQSVDKKPRPETPAVRILPKEYELCDVRDLVLLIASMLNELVQFNDKIELKDNSLTRFHSRAPPGISVQDYLQRLTTHSTLSPPILLSMVYYIDRLCAMYPAFTITSLTVHRFLIASSTVASKGLSDSFWTNKTYAKVGGVSLKELALLELEFLTRIDWRIVPQNAVLCDYYVSLVKRSDTHRLENDEDARKEDEVQDEDKG